MATSTQSACWTNPCGPRHLKDVTEDERKRWAKPGALFKFGYGTVSFPVPCLCSCCQVVTLLYLVENEKFIPGETPLEQVLTALTQLSCGASRQQLEEGWVPTPGAHGSPPCLAVGGQQLGVSPPAPPAEAGNEWCLHERNRSAPGRRCLI